MDKKEIIIIGAGIAGLSAGCYLQMNGYNTRIFEMWKLPGGVCTAWQRKGYTFDGCIHWVVGTKPSHTFYTIWSELGALKGRQIIDFDELTRIEYQDGKVFVLYSDMDKLESEMKEIAPEDTKIIKELADDVRVLSRYDLPVLKAYELLNIGELLGILFTKFPVMRILLKWKKVSVQQLAEKCKNKHLKELIPRFIGSGDISMIGLVMMLAAMHTKAAGYPIGGSLEFSKSIEKRYIELGGSISYGAKVAKILTENDRANGIRLENGEEHRADIVISAADGHYTIFDMLEGKYADEDIVDKYENLPLFPSMMQVSLGVARAFKDPLHYINFPLHKPLMTSHKHQIKRMSVRIYNFDPSLTPGNKTTLVALVGTDYEYWKGLAAQGPEQYEAQKERILNDVIDELDRKLGNIRSFVEVTDIATPLTYIRYTNNWKGCFEGWFPVPGTLARKFRKTLPGLGNFYTIGQWVEPGGGLPQAALSGRNVAQVICKKDRKKFKTIL